MESMQFNDVKTEQLSKTGEPFIDGIECIEAMEPKKKEDVMEALAFLRAKFRDGAEKLPSEEREKYRNVFQHIIEEFRGMEESLTRTECNPDDRVLQMNGPFRRDETGALCAPKKEDVQASFLQVMRRGEVCIPIEVESVSVEENYVHMLYGPANPNYLYKEPNMFVKFKTLEQTKIVETNIKSRTVSYQVGSTLTGSNYRFSVPALNSADRAAYRAIGDLITRIKTVDSKLKALGAVPGRGGLPELSDKLIQKDDFDTYINSLRAADTQRVRWDPLMKQQELHGWLCTRTRVDKSKRQAALEPLVDERIDILLKLAMFDPDQYPVVIEREFK
jgi:Asp-tRNA(Asn)/Glu-tRNA(Gln) amidotransferase C subunit